MLTDRHIKKYQNLCLRRFGYKPAYDEARMKLSLLVRQMEIIYQPVTAAQLKALQDEDNKANGGNEGNEKLLSRK